VIKLGYRDGLRARRGHRPGLERLFQAADEDSATGGPDAMRGIYPIIATITADGFERLGDDEADRALRSSSRPPAAEPGGEPRGESDR
jgi:proteasome beta subunit